MHEESLVRSLIRQAESIAAAHGGATLDEVTVETGPLSGVEPELMQSAFDRLTVGTRHAEARLVLQLVPLRLSCGRCEQVSELSEVSFACPHCGARDVHINGGDSIILKEVTTTVEQTQQTESV